MLCFGLRFSPFFKCGFFPLLFSPLLVSFSLSFAFLLEIKKVAARPALSESVTQGEARTDALSHSLSRARVLGDIVTILPPSVASQSCLAVAVRLSDPRGGSDH